AATARADLRGAPLSAPHTRSKSSAAEEPLTPAGWVGKRFQRPDGWPRRMSALAGAGRAGFLHLAGCANRPGGVAACHSANETGAGVPMREYACRGPHCPALPAFVLHSVALSRGIVNERHMGDTTRPFPSPASRPP